MHWRPQDGNSGKAGATGLLPQGPFLGPMALVMQPQRPQGTLTVRWSRHGWQVYWKLANWQYLRGPQSSSMMHSWVGGEQLCQERQVSEPTVSGKGNGLFVPQSRPHRLRAQEQSPDAPQCPSTPSPAQLAPGVQPPTSTQAGRALTHSAHPSFCPVGCRA